MMIDESPSGRAVGQFVRQPLQSLEHSLSAVGAGDAGRCPEQAPANMARRNCRARLRSAYIREV
jgi:hypothetical protein